MPSIPKDRPDSLKDAPIPPNVQQVLWLFRQLYNGNRVEITESGWLPLPLEVGEYDILRTITRREPSLGGYVEDKIRFDFIPKDSQLVIRMPTSFHGQFCWYLLRFCEEQISRTIKLSSPSSLAALLQDVECGGTTDFFDFNDARHKRSPDGQFGHGEEKYPGLIFEVANSQSTKNLGKVARDAIRMSRGNIRMVICIDLEYKPRKEEDEVDRILTWEPKFVNGVNGDPPRMSCVCTYEKIFRRNGSPVNQAETLHVPLRVLVPFSDLDGIDALDRQRAESVIAIPFQKLIEWISKVKDFNEARRLGFVNHGDPNMIVEGSSSSEDGLLGEDESTWIKEEQETGQRDKESCGYVTVTKPSSSD